MESSRVMLDSLPYIENIHEDYEEFALSLIEEEMRNSKPRPLAKMPPLNFRTSLMKSEYETLVVEGREFVPRSGGDFLTTKKISRASSLEDWTNSAIPLAKSQLEMERLRGLVLEAEKEEAVASMKDFNNSIESLKAQWVHLLKTQQEAVEEINYQRQQAQQQKFGPELDQLVQEYEQLLYRRNQLEHAIEGLKRGGQRT